MQYLHSLTPLKVANYHFDDFVNRRSVAWLVRPAAAENGLEDVGSVGGEREDVGRFCLEV